MRIVAVTAHRLKIPFRTLFAHSLHARAAAEPIVLVVESDCGRTGLGEVLPRPYLTGETLDSVWATHLPALAGRWLNREFADRDQVIEALREELRGTDRALATLAGWELAMLDLSGKVFGFAAGDVLGPPLSPKLAPGFVIDFSIATERLQKHCRLLRLTGKQHFKIKVGLPDDRERLSIVQEVFGRDFPLRLDANAAWTLDQAIETLTDWRRFLIHSVEQPLPAGDLAGMRRLREECGIALVADEALCSLEDARRLIAAQAADIFNIRIAKCGGMLASAQLVRFAQQAGLGVQIGMLVGETGILASAAEAFGRRVPGFACLEGMGQNKTLLQHDIVEPMPEGAVTGLGLALAGPLDRWSSRPPILFSTRHKSLA